MPAVVVLILVAAVLGGWLTNLVELAFALGEPAVQLTVLLAARAVGVIIVPLGAVLGFI